MVRCGTHPALGMPRPPLEGARSRARLCAPGVEHRHQAAADDFADPSLRRPSATNGVAASAATCQPPSGVIPGERPMLDSRAGKVVRPAVAERANERLPV